MKKISAMLPKNAVSSEFRGLFRITQCLTQFDDFDNPYFNMVLSNSEGDYPALMWIDEMNGLEVQGHLVAVEVEGVYFKSPHPLVIIEQLKSATTTTSQYYPVLQSLPRSKAVDTAVFDQLLAFVRALETEVLRRFVSLVVERQGRIERFLTAPGSTKNHHAYKGGLLVHSIQVGEGVKSMINSYEPDLSPVLKETGMVGGLLHDIGKIQYYNTVGKAIEQRYLVDHDAMTLELCAPGLAYLDKVAPELSTTLRHIWTAASPGARYGHQPMISLARYVRDADAHSMLADNQRAAFTKGTRHGFRRLGRDRYWLPKLADMTKLNK